MQMATTPPGWRGRQHHRAALLQGFCWLQQPCQKHLPVPQNVLSYWQLTFFPFSLREQNSGAVTLFMVLPQREPVDLCPPSTTLLQ